MKDIEKRSPGKYKKEFIKIIENKEYKMIEEYVIGRDYQIMNYSREYIPAIPANFNWDKYN